MKKPPHPGRCSGFPSINSEAQRFGLCSKERRDSMGKQADIEPRWLVSLMCQWVRRQNALEDGALGFPSKAAFLTIGTASNARTDPTEFSARDFTELEAALAHLLAVEPSQWAAMMMYYRPWMVAALRAEGWPFGNSTYFYRLHAAHTRVSLYILDHAPVREHFETVVA